MKSADKPLSEYERTREENRSNVVALSLAVIFFIGLLTAVATSGCASTVVPTTVQSSEASFDGNEQNSGILLTTKSGFVVTARFRERYNALLATYGGDFSPPLKPDQDIAPMGGDRWLISKQGMVHMLTMNQWKKAGIPPKS